MNPSCLRQSLAVARRLHPWKFSYRALPFSAIQPLAYYHDQESEWQREYSSTREYSPDMARHTGKSALFLVPRRQESTAAEMEMLNSTTEKFEYQAEVARLLDLIIHSLYSHREVFLRELISNASDALDKFRFLSVTDPNLLNTGSDLKIQIKADSDSGTLTIIDTGIGMTKEELIESLGTIAESGTAKFLKALKENKDSVVGDNNLIGQFGVGFYSAFLVAEKVAVSTKHPKSDKQYVWEGQADSNSYTVQEETNPERLLTRGTCITLFLKKDAKYEFSDSTRILNLVKNYSQFISFPIYMWQEKTREVEVVDDSAKQDMDPQGKVNKKPKTKTEKYYDWEMVNNTKPIWLRNPKEVSKEEYVDFFKNTFNQYGEPMAYTHFTTEGEIEFKTLLYIPGMAPLTAEDASGPRVKNIRMYVKRVFISDEFDGELFPRYLGFIKGVVDSNDLPLNVSREILQESHIVKVMRKRLVKKTFEMIEDIAKRDNKEDYQKFWKNFGKYIKMGCIDDAGSCKQLVSLLRFYSSKNEDKMISLKDYVENMKEDQKGIYYYAAETINSAKTAPFLEELLERNIEVLYLIDPIDEIAIANLKSFEGKMFVDVSKEDLDIADSEEKDGELQKDYSQLCDWIKTQLGDKVAKVQLSKRLKSSPCALVAPSDGWSANMERIMKAQTLGDTLDSAIEYAHGTRILEVNPNHCIIKELCDLCKRDSEYSSTKEIVGVLYETALLSSGFTLEDPSSYGVKVFEIMATSLKEHIESRGFGIDGTAAVSS